MSLRERGAGRLSGLTGDCGVSFAVGLRVVVGRLKSVVVGQKFSVWDASLVVELVCARDVRQDSFPS